MKREMEGWKGLKMYWIKSGIISFWGAGEAVQNQSSSEWPEIRFGFGTFEIDQICKWSHSNVNKRLDTIVTS